MENTSGREREGETEQAIVALVQKQVQPHKWSYCSTWNLFKCNLRHLVLKKSNESQSCAPELQKKEKNCSFIKGVARASPVIFLFFLFL